MSPDVRPDWRPVSEGGIGRPKPRRNQKTRGHVGTIAEIRAAKCSGPCRVCGQLVPLEAHHLIPRSRMGRWVRENIIGLCQNCHRDITDNDPAALTRLAVLLQGDGEEYPFLVEELGEGAMTRLFGVMPDEARP